MIGYVPPPYEPGLWAAVVRLLDPAVARYGNGWDEVNEALASNRAQLWVAYDGEPSAAMVTQVGGGELQVWFAGGRLLGIVPYLDWIIEASKEAGTTCGRICGRRGWERVLKQFGWKREGADLVKRWSNHGR